MGDECRHCAAWLLLLSLITISHQYSPVGIGSSFNLLNVSSVPTTLQWVQAAPPHSLITLLCLLPPPFSQRLIKKKLLFQMLSSHKQGSLLGGQTPSFLHFFSSRPPGNYAFLLRPLEGENLLKHVVKRLLKTHVFAPSSLTALAPNSTYGLLFKLSFLGLLQEDFSKLSLKGKLALSNFVTHASFYLWANAACFFKRNSSF
ncbi:unnamed protein product [Acanthosepion pharaonis]|uniref:Uncharacterized protein n=1 Tax=Acanthosepion pharaonis TaxID=158019 RepID=A0A812CUD0_ACAPH|nr:unnamed protein product [Sepia pharaonis]